MSTLSLFGAHWNVFR